MLGAGSQGKSLKYESIVNIPQTSQIQLPSGNVVTSISHLQSGSDNLTSSPQLQPSPYVYRHRQDDNFVTHLNTEDFVSPSSWRPPSLTPVRPPVSLTSALSALSALSVSDHSQFPEQQQMTMSTFQRPEDVTRAQGRGHQPQPPQSVRPPQLQREPAIGKEDIKVIHFGVV